MLIDLHCHSSVYSACSTLDVAASVALARERGLDGICLTEHDRMWPAAELAAIRTEHGFPIFSGVEFTTERGHVLAFGLTGMPARPGHIASVAERAASDGGLLFLAHPARDGTARIDEELLAALTSVEAINGSDSRLNDLSAAVFARVLRHPGVGGSDAHSPDEVARAATRFLDRVGSDADLLAALRAGRYEAVRLR